MLYSLNPELDINVRMWETTFLSIWPVLEGRCTHLVHCSESLTALCLESKVATNPHILLYFPLVFHGSSLPPWPRYQT